MKEFKIDGNDFNDLDGFFDVIGNQLAENNDWGKNWNAFNDILWGGFVRTDYEEPFTLIWKNHQLSKDRLNEFDDIVSLIEEHKHITLELK